MITTPEQETWLMSIANDEPDARLLRCALLGWNNDGGCWFGPQRFEGATMVLRLLGEQDIAAVLETSGPDDHNGEPVEVRVRSTDPGIAYWWPNEPTVLGVRQELERWCVHS